MTDLCRLAMPGVLQRLLAAWNAHDVDALADCLHPAYESLHPLHPERHLRGRAAAVQSWGAVFTSIPDLRAELRLYTVGENTLWTEWRWHGTHIDGAAYNAGGVMIFGWAEERLLWARAYTETCCIEGPNFDRLLEDLLGHETET